MLLLVPVAPQSETSGWVALGIVVLLFLVMQLILFRRQIFKKKTGPGKTR
jgi:hypothetical protein